MHPNYRRPGHEWNSFGDEDGAVSRLVNGGDQINGVIHHQFSWQVTAEINSLLLWRGVEGGTRGGCPVLDD